MNKYSLKNLILDANVRYFAGLKDVNQKIGPGDVKALYKPPADSHRGQNGQLMTIAGSKRYHGAPLLATQMASKIVDLVFFSSVPENNELVRKMKSKLREFIIVPREEVEKFIKRCDAILIGPGMGESRETSGLTNRLLRKYGYHPNYTPSLSKGSKTKSSTRFRSLRQ
jgi:NAD(P)H-hydrate epimerase